MSDTESLSTQINKIWYRAAATYGNDLAKIQQVFHNEVVAAGLLQISQTTQTPVLRGGVALPIFADHIAQHLINRGYVVYMSRIFSQDLKLVEKKPPST